jgi:hypothetical protein
VMLISAKSASNAKMPSFRSIPLHVHIFIPPFYSL